MSLNSMLNIASSGLNTAQTQLRVISDNVSNVNTPGYIRKLADQEARTQQGVGAGVDVARIRLATDRFLQVASLNAASDSGSQSVQFELYDNLQNLFGDPGQDGYFSKIDTLFSGLMAAAENATSGPLRQEAMYQLKVALEESGRVASGIQSIRADADSRLTNAVMRSNELLEQIEKLNNEIAKANIVGADATGAESAQSLLVGELAGLMDVRITNRAVGGIEIRTGNGILLAGQGVAKLAYNRSGSVTSQTSFADVVVTEPSGTQKSLTQNLNSGEIKGLLNIRDIEAPQAAARLAELTSRMVDEMNRAHNAASAIPAPSIMTGRNTGQTLDNALAGFVGKTTIAVVNSEGRIQSQTEIEFLANGTMIFDGALPAITSAGFLSTVEAKLGGVTASFTGGVLSLSAANGNGLAIADDEMAPGRKDGRGFSHFFGLNDLVTTGDFLHYETGLKSDSQHGFTPGQTMSFRFDDGQSNRLKDLEFTMPAGDGQMGSLISALNDPATGIGRYGTFSLSPQGELIFVGRGNPAAQMSVLADNTNHPQTGVSMSRLFGMGDGVRTSSANKLAIRSDIARDSQNLALAKLDLSVAPGAIAISAHDGRGGQALANANQVATRFSAAGAAGASEISLSRYASEFSGELGIRATSFKTQASHADLILTEAMARRASVEGVNLDEELVKLTTFQQAYNASARMIQAVSEMYDTLIGMVR